MFIPVFSATVRTLGFSFVSHLMSNPDTFVGSTISWYSTAFYCYHVTKIPLPISRHPHGSIPPSFHFVRNDQALANTLIFLYPHIFSTVVAPKRCGLVRIIPPPVLPTTNPPAMQKPCHSLPHDLEEYQHKWRRAAPLVGIPGRTTRYAIQGVACEDEKAAPVD